MTKDPVPADVMSMLVRLAQRPDKDHMARRTRFRAAFSACAGMANNHPEIALHWLDALKTGLSWRRIKQINDLSTLITIETVASRQHTLFKP